MVLTPRRVALAAAEALAEGLLGLPVKEKLVSRFSSSRGVKDENFRFCFIVAYQCSWWWKTLSFVGVVVGTVAGESRRSRRKSQGRDRKSSKFATDYGPTIAASAILAKPQASTFSTL